MTHLRWAAAAAGIASLLAAQPARAWDWVGHQVIARIAWENMTPRARAAATALLSAAPAGSDITDALPATGSDDLRRRTLFVKTATWADEVRNNQLPARQAAYHRPSWHYINWFFERTPQGDRDRPDVPPEAEHAVMRLDGFARGVVDLDRPSADRAVDLAWIIHLAGDIHQPLHTTARLVGDPPRGDQGGNLFRLAGNTSLHGWWDGALRRGYARRDGEEEQAYIGRVADALMARHPAGGFAAERGQHSAEAWAREGYALHTQVYGTPENQAPGDAYARWTQDTAEARAALAGYRLADLLNRVLAGE